jgi:hypothetical protein
MTIDPLACTVLSPTKTFDTCADDAAAGNLNAFLDGVPNGAIIVGVTGDEPQSRLNGSIAKLSSYGVNVNDIQYRGNFAFVAQKGSPTKTKFVKQLTNSSPYSSDLNVNMQELCEWNIQTATKCSVSIRAYSASTPGVLTDGYIKLNGVAVWEAGWYSSKPNIRGVSLMTIDPLTCTVLSPTKTFDTCADDAAAGNLNTFLDGVPNGNVIVGVTGDEPQSRLGGSIAKLSSYGVDVSDILYRGNFAFVAQKGSPTKTQFTKMLTSSSPFLSNLNVDVLGGLTAADVTIDLVNKTP